MDRSKVALALVLIFMSGCGGGSGSPGATGPAVSGAYEFTVTSNVTGSTTLIEANLAANGTSSSASGPKQVQILSKQNGVWYLNGICPGSTPGQNSVSTSMNGNNVALIFNEGGNSFSGEGMLTGTSVSASYTINNSTCPALANLNTEEPPGYDQGGITGNPVSPLAGTFSGVLNLPNGADNASLTLTEASNGTLMVEAKLKGIIDNGTFTFSGSAVSNIMFVSGSVSGKPLSLFGYYDRDGSVTGMVNSLLVFDYDALANAGLLLGQ
jgi:hypothetical protein